MSVFASFPSASGVIYNILLVKDPESLDWEKVLTERLKEFKLAKANKWTQSSATPYWNERSDFGEQESWYQFVQDFMTATAKRSQVLLNKGIDVQTHPLPAEPKSRGLCRKETNKK